MPTRNPNPQTRWVDSTNPRGLLKYGGLAEWSKAIELLSGGLAEWSKAIESTKHPLTISTARNQFRSRAHVRIMQPSLHIFFICLCRRKVKTGGLAEWSKAIEYVSLQHSVHKTFTNNLHS
ncbi:hypothetical protein N7465_005917 [Penicillium sp. CMV-2018d]|nr:hypothetical protein N7465_005917 [Penicillium sp. CMV-2018d]